CPFFQLVHVINLNETLQKLKTIEESCFGLLVRDGGYVSLAISEQNFRQEEVRRNILQLLEIMRF
ncbi:hypothetical protein DZ819_25195, partial [Vibrio parahaemolyticus]|nr:hypothetical protein [Vibrio parahaemolyticus]